MVEVDLEEEVELVERVLMEYTVMPIVPHILYIIQRDHFITIIGVLTIIMLVTLSVIHIHTVVMDLYHLREEMVEQVDLVDMVERG